MKYEACRAFSLLFATSLENSIIKEQSILDSIFYMTTQLLKITF